ncbi:MAG: site-specific DNA-methyltransferase [bacterium]|nr:site-specific DNA-methyltransferase [bacterium]
MPTLDFKGKAHIYGHHLVVPWHPLVPHPDRSVGTGDVDDNLIVHGDNLHALKALLPRYAGRVKCVYIDPPYNTGNEGWVYNDNGNSPALRHWLSENGPVDGEDLERHDKWLTMMWPRLQLLRLLLSDDGVIFVSVDDNEVHHLRMMMDEIFGEENFVGSFVWEGTGKNDARFISVGHDYVLCYARDITLTRENGNRWRALKEGVDEINSVAASAWETHSGDSVAASAALQEWFAGLDKRHSAFPHRHYRWVDERGVYFAGDISWPGGGGPTYEILHPVTQKPVRVPSRGWRYPDRQRLVDLIEDDRVHFGADENTVPQLKRYLNETSGQVLTSVFYQDRRAAHQELVRILPAVDFQYPKDERVIRRLLEVVTSDDDIILDSFAGSGTTGHAVLALNAADGGNRRFIMVECEEYADDVTAERMRRVIAGVPEARDPSLREGLGGTFTYCTLGERTSGDGMLTGESLPSYDDLAAWLVHSATGQSIGTKDLASGDEHGLIYSTGDTDYYLIYEPDIEWLQSNESVLTAPRAEAIGSVCGERDRTAVVFATARYIPQDELKDMGVMFAQLPFAVQQIDEA